MIVTICVASSYILSILTHNEMFEKIGRNLMTSNNSVIVLASASLIFLTFKNIKIKSSAFINTLAKSVLGVYLIHDNELVRKVIWAQLFPANIQANSVQFVLFAIIKCALIFAICLVIDQIRIATVKTIKSKLCYNKKNAQA